MQATASYKYKIHTLYIYAPTQIAWVYFRDCVCDVVYTLATLAEIIDIIDAEMYKSCTYTTDNT